MPGVEFDVEALRQKYAQERDRRLRPDGIEQYVEISGAFADFATDPWSDRDFTRDPLSDEVDVAIIGAGFGGLLTGARLRELGVHSIRLIDKAADVGGTWYWNRYPGIACDVESYVYMPLLEELGYVPTEKYAKGPEIFAHCRSIAEHYDLYRDICLQTEVQQIRWDAELQRWIIATNHGDSIRARFVAMANGYLQKPKLPGIEGISDFAGQTFHTSRWDYDYTGADLANLADKKVGIIGTGATAIQCVPHLAKAAKELLVFQRTPSTVDVRGNRPTDPDWSGSLQTDGSAVASRTSSCSPRAAKPTRISSTTHGRASSRNCSSCGRPVSRECPTKTVYAQLNWPTLPRWKRSGPASIRSWRIRRQQRRSNPGTATSASGPAFTTTTCSRSTGTT